MESATALDVSEGGLGIAMLHTPDGCDTDAAISVMLALPGEKALMVKAKIRHVSKVRGTFGIEFVELTEEHRNVLNHYVKKRLDAGAVVP